MHVAERAELEALRDLYAACPRDVAKRLGAHAQATGDSLAFSCTFLAAARELNRVVGASTVEHLDSAEAFFSRLGVAFHVSLMPGTGLEDELASRGYEPGYPWMRFTRRAVGPPEATTSLRIEEVGTDRAIEFAAGAGARRARSSPGGSTLRREPAARSSSRRPAPAPTADPRVRTGTSSGRAFGTSTSARTTVRATSGGHRRRRLSGR